MPEKSLTKFKEALANLHNSADKILDNLEELRKLLDKVLDAAMDIQLENNNEKVIRAFLKLVHLIDLIEGVRFILAVIARVIHEECLNMGVHP